MVNRFETASIYKVETCIDPMVNVFNIYNVEGMLHIHLKFWYFRTMESAVMDRNST